MRSDIGGPSSDISHPRKPYFQPSTFRRRRADQNRKPNAARCRYISTSGIAFQMGYPVQSPRSQKSGKVIWVTSIIAEEPEGLSIIITGTDPPKQFAIVGQRAELTVSGERGKTWRKGVLSGSTRTTCRRLLKLRNSKQGLAWLSRHLTSSCKPRLTARMQQ